ncbi:rod shape-determining protein RodA [Psychroflexus lacisalsi]|jgi:rod shape determining protein RodA|uniref:Rod shape-determining protein RodA n=1 Tax=Psychroflexus lacisalsi TaxID=503928 RepID=A0ABN1K1U7_9FLAO|nr:rod shape-determining protein RodA [Psychroflexus lacisalsi]MBZ9621049.1 rod shape-determining protein RodA [Psychroflexus lacisalsi]
MPKTLLQIDWLTILIIAILIGFGWGNIYSTTFVSPDESILDLSKIYGKQLLWIFLGALIGVVILALESKFFERFANIIYLFAVLSLLGLFAFGKTIAGQTAWYSFGAFSIQPAEFVKVAVALALAKYISDLDNDLSRFKSQFKAFAIIGVPLALIMLQPDAGSALIYLAFLIPLYREGLPHFYISIGFLTAAIFILTLKFGFTLFAPIFGVLIIIVYLFNKRNKPKLWKYALILLFGIGFSYSVNFILNSVLLPHQKDRFDVLIGETNDIKGSAFNLYQSEVAIGSGGWTGKGWLKGSQTQGRFVPEQHTDYIFSTVGEEWGFMGTSIVVILFTLLILRLFHLAERQKNQFSRVYGYSVMSVIFVHFFVNVAMVIGLFPTVGIPLPFFSYGGSGLWGFLILVLIFLKLDAKRKSLN